MTKELNIGNIKLSLPDYNSDVGRAIELLQNQYESGNIKAMLVVYATNDSIASAIVGDSMVIPFVSMAAEVISATALDQIEESLTSSAKTD
jgi:hypothetical protein